jgi:hypothetical protein
MNPVCMIEIPIRGLLFRSLIVLVSIGCIMGGCTYERVVSQSGLLSGLDGAQSKLPAKQQARALPDFLRTPDEGIRVVDEDGTVTLYAKSVRQLMAHISTTIANGERDLFVEQVLCKLTKDEFYERGLDPGLAFDELVRRERDIGRMFYYMPMGEYTPGLYLKTIGRNTFRLKLPRANNEALHWLGMDVVFEDRNYRLRWFLPNG